jgi:hypothetical protein
MVRGLSTCTSVRKGGNSSIEFQPSSKTCLVTGSNRPDGLMPAERPRLRSGRTRMPLSSTTALAISALPVPKAAASARTICSILALSQGFSAGFRISALMENIPTIDIRTNQEQFCSSPWSIYGASGAPLAPGAPAGASSRME